MPRPIPAPDDLSRPFWEACNEKRLAVQHCTACDRLQYPPQPRCTSCGVGDHMAWKETSGRGHILEFVVIYDSRIKGFQSEQPFNFAVITLDDDPGLNFLSNLPGRPVGDVPVGAPVEVIFEPTGSGQLVHEWRVIGATEPRP